MLKSLKRFKNNNSIALHGDCYIIKKLPVSYLVIN